MVPEAAGHNRETQQAKPPREQPMSSTEACETTTIKVLQAVFTDYYGESRKRDYSGDRRRTQNSDAEESNWDTRLHAACLPQETGTGRRRTLRHWIARLRLSHGAVGSPGAIVRRVACDAKLVRVRLRRRRAGRGATGQACSELGG